MHKADFPIVQQQTSGNRLPSKCHISRLSWRLTAAQRSQATRALLHKATKPGLRRRRTGAGMA
ncbi:hypothetical protein PCL1606_49290 [Pseudomonas chlororaphis]|uniref:Uncharacterized protein n=1 Tax=Pseudomonas chlororaphis TaxID=587753 RepID=A0A0D5Y5V9_9PSED|nr:hypothetical protein PCL1606_49290 [Pseudomonas chlororaphis]